MTTTTNPEAFARADTAFAAGSTVRLDVELATLAEREGAEAPSPRELIPLFHELIREQVLDDLLIDVADYSHVPEGPGLVLVGHDAVIEYKDRAGDAEGRRSLVYSRRRESWRPLEAPSSGARLRAALLKALAVASLLEQRLGERLRWDTRVFEISLNDRLRAPQAGATRLAWRPEVEALAKTLYPDAEPRVVDRGEDPRERVGFRVEGDRSERIEVLVGRLE